MPQVIFPRSSASLASSGRPTATAPVFMQNSLSQNPRIATFMQNSLSYMQYSVS